jgi:hypothetical protein
VQHIRKLRCPHDEGEIYYIHVNDNPDNPVAGFILKCSKCQSVVGTHGEPRKGAKLFNDKGQWVGTNT